MMPLGVWNELIVSSTLQPQQAFKLNLREGIMGISTWVNRDVHTSSIPISRPSMLPCLTS